MCVTAYRFLARNRSNGDDKHVLFVEENAQFPQGVVMLGDIFLQVPALSLNLYTLLLHPTIDVAIVSATATTSTATQKNKEKYDAHYPDKNPLCRR